MPRAKRKRKRKPPKSPRPPGRPSKYTAALADEICRRLEQGQSVREIDRDPTMPGANTIYQWLKEREPFREQYARAREAQAHRLADELVEIADDGSNDWVERQTLTGQTFMVVDHEHITRSKLRVDTRKFLLAKLLPKVYGDVTRLEHSGPDGGPIPMGALTDEQLLAKAKRAGIPRDRWPARVRELDERQSSQRKVD